MASGTRSGGVPGRGDTGGSRGVENAQGPDPDIRRLSAPSIEALARALKDGRKGLASGKPLKGGSSTDSRGYWFLWISQLEGLIYENYGIRTLKRLH